MIFIISGPCRLLKNKRLESLLFFMVLMKDKYLLYIINEMKNMIDLLRDFLYIYKRKDIITFDMNSSYI
jgi:hypothetical protein